MEQLKAALRLLNTVSNSFAVEEAIKLIEDFIYSSDNSYVKICDANPRDWYNSVRGRYFAVEISSGFSDFYIITEGEFRGKYISREHCKTFNQLPKNTHPQLREELVKGLTANIPRDIMFNKDTPERIVKQADKILERMFDGKHILKQLNNQKEYKG